jgi:hypothetical protein
MSEPGLDLHEWETRWAELEDVVADAPDEALPEMVRVIEQALGERGFELDEPVTLEGEDPEIVSRFQSAREVARGLETADPEDVSTAIEDLSMIFEYLTTGHAPP